MNFFIVCVVGCLMLQTRTMQAAEPVPPGEFGKATFLRDYPTALAKAKADKKPLLILFDEIPGCQTCRDFGSGPLSHPVIVKTIADEFVAVAVANNIKGADAEVLARYKEQAWNNPIVRLLDADGKDIVPRQEDYSAHVMMKRMIAALEKSKRAVPMELTAAATGVAIKPETAVFAMHCYWVGEAKLGLLDGVVGTRIGELQKDEVVEVTFDANVIDFSTLVKKAMEIDCSHRVFARTDEQFKLAEKLVGKKVTRTDDAIDCNTQQQWHMAKLHLYHYLPLSPYQATKVNAMIAHDRLPDEYLDTKQLEYKIRFGKVTAEEYKAIQQFKPDRTDKGRVAYTNELKDLLKMK